MLYSPKKHFVILHPHLPITATFFRPQGHGCGEVQLFKMINYYIIENITFWKIASSVIYK